jgi:hypothetical protein
MDEEHMPRDARLGLPNKSTVELYLIGRADAHTEYGTLAVDGDSSCANPILYLAAGCQAGARQHFLKTLVLSGPVAWL